MEGDKRISRLEPHTNAGLSEDSGSPYPSGLPPNLLKKENSTYTVSGPENISETTDTYVSFDSEYNHLTPMFIPKENVIYDEFTNFGFARHLFLTAHGVFSSDRQYPTVKAPVYLELNKLPKIKRFKSVFYFDTVNKLIWGKTKDYDNTSYLSVFYSPEVSNMEFLLKFTNEVIRPNVIKNEPKEEKKNSYPVNIIVSENGNLSLREVSLEPNKDESLNFSIEDNYQDSFVQFDIELQNFLNKKDSGVFIMRSDAGCGKTFYLRKLMRDRRDREFIFMPPNMVSYLNDPSFVPFAMEHLKDKVLIVEDAEDALRKRTGVNNSPVSAVLNMSDGVMGDLFRTTFIFTINCKFSDIDQAVLRKGRIVAKEELGKLPMDKCNKLLKSLGSDMVTDEDMKLCDVYNFAQKDFDEKRTKIGF